MKIIWLVEKSTGEFSRAASKKGTVRLLYPTFTLASLSPRTKLASKRCTWSKSSLFHILYFFLVAYIIYVETQLPLTIINPIPYLSFPKKRLQRRFSNVRLYYTTISEYPWLFICFYFHLWRSANWSGKCSRKAARNISNILAKLQDSVPTASAFFRPRANARYPTWPFQIFQQALP